MLEISMVVDIGSLETGNVLGEHNGNIPRYRCGKSILLLNGV